MNGVCLLGGHIQAAPTSPLSAMFRLTSAVLVTATLMSGYAVSGEPAKTAQARMPPYLDTSSYGGGNGLSESTAIIVKAQNEARGVASEYAWIASRYPGVKPLEQLLTATDDAGKTYDVITVQTSTGAKMVLWFDISAMYEIDFNPSIEDALRYYDEQSGGPKCSFCGKRPFDVKGWPTAPAL